MALWVAIRHGIHGKGAPCSGSGGGAPEASVGQLPFELGSDGGVVGGWCAEGALPLDRIALTEMDHHVHPAKGAKRENAQEQTR